MPSGAGSLQETLRGGGLSQGNDSVTSTTSEVPQFCLADWSRQTCAERSGVRAEARSVMYSQSVCSFAAGIMYDLAFLLPRHSEGDVKATPNVFQLRAAPASENTPSQGRPLRLVGTPCHISKAH